FQAEDGIRDFHVTGVQTCALPILLRTSRSSMVARLSRSSEGAITTRCPTDSKALKRSLAKSSALSRQAFDVVTSTSSFLKDLRRSEERRVGKECRSRWSP